MSKHLIVVKQSYGWIYCTKSVLRLLRNEFSVKRKGSYFIDPMFAKIYFITPNGRFLSGLYKSICKFLNENNIEYEFHDQRKKVYVDKRVVLKRLDKFKLSLREEYQIPALLKALKNPYCGFSWPTASGKGVFISALIASYGLRTLVLIHTKELMYQLANDISTHLNTEVGIIGDGKNDPKKITVGIVASLVNNKHKRFLGEIEHIICDEYHHEAAKTWRAIVLSCKIALIKNGFSATAFRNDSKTLYLEGLTGPIIQKISTSKMIKWGFLSRPHIDIASIKQAKIENMKWQDAYKYGIVESNIRNKFACKWLINYYRKDKSIIVFVDRIKHGQDFKRLLINSGVNYRDIDFMSGSERISVRKNTLDSFRNQRLKVLIGTKIFNEGINLPATNVGINLAGGDGSIPTIQKLGRLLRKSKMDGIDVDRHEETINYLDFNDMNSKYLRKHSRSRIKVYEKEKAFKIKKIS